VRAQGLDPWHDPHNEDRRFARVRVRLDVLPVLETALGPGVAEALARTATQLRADADVLDAMTARQSAGSPALTTADLAELPDAIRSPRAALGRRGGRVPAGALTSAHVRRVDELITSWHGQRWVDLPGGSGRRGATDKSCLAEGWLMDANDMGSSLKEILITTERLQRGSASSRPRSMPITPTANCSSWECSRGRSW